jgi:hypothetical protein
MNARTFLLDYLRYGPADAVAVYEAAETVLGLDGPTITAALLALNVHVTERDGKTIVALPRNVFAIWWAKPQLLRPRFAGAGGNAA